MRNLLEGFDRKAVAVIVGTLAFFVLLFGFLPRWLTQKAAEDLGGAATQTAPGVVVRPEISPVGEFGTDIFNAVVVSFAGRRAFFSLPRQTTWRPKANDAVQVTYRVGTRSGMVHVDGVTPLPENLAKPSARK